MIRFTKRQCGSCRARKSIAEFSGRQHGSCDRCLSNRREAKRHKAITTLRVVEVIGSRRYHIATEGSCKTYCRCGNAVPLVYGNGPAMLVDLLNDPACCSKCRAKLEALFG